jgi:hypothetical protein
MGTRFRSLAAARKGCEASDSNCHSQQSELDSNPVELQHCENAGVRCTKLRRRELPPAANFISTGSAKICRLDPA